ncbi:MFS transporter, partial [Mycobacterium sp. ITM-2017-0098]
RGGAILALGMVAAGMGLAGWAATVLTVGAALVAAAVLGAGYGVALLVGLQEIQRIAGPDDLAGLTAVFYSLSYLGFAVPAVLAFLAPAVSYPTMFAFGALVAVTCLIVAAVGSSRAAAIS